MELVGVHHQLFLERARRIIVCRQAQTFVEHVPARHAHTRVIAGEAGDPFAETVLVQDQPAFQPMEQIAVVVEGGAVGGEHAIDADVVQQAADDDELLVRPGQALALGPERVSSREIPRQQGNDAAVRPEQAERGWVRRAGAVQFADAVPSDGRAVEVRDAIEDSRNGAGRGR